MKDFKKLAVWQQSHSLTLDDCRASATFPRDEMYSLTSQRRRAAASMGANIAEDCCRDGDAAFARFLHIAIGSAGELENHELLARDIGLLSPEAAVQLWGAIAEAKRLLVSLIRKLKANR